MGKLKIIVQGDLIIKSDEEPNKSPSSRSMFEKMVDRAFGERGKGIKATETPIVVNTYTVQGVMTYMDEMYENAIKQAGETTNEEVRTFFQTNAENYKAASVALHSVMQRVDIWEKQKGEPAPKPEATETDKKFKPGGIGSFLEGLGGYFARDRGKS